MAEVWFLTGVLHFGRAFCLDEQSKDSGQLHWSNFFPKVKGWDLRIGLFQWRKESPDKALLPPTLLRISFLLLDLKQIWLNTNA